jgi:hypothetical protein
MQPVGFHSLCSFPYAGVNCTEDYTAQVYPAIEYTNWIGIITYILLAVPSAFATRTCWNDYYMTGDQSQQSAPGLRLVCALSTLFAALFGIMLFATGMLITYPANTSIGALSFMATMGTNCSNTVATCTILLVTRRVFFATITRHGQRRESSFEASEIRMALSFLAPATLGFAATTVLAVSGAVGDNVILLRINIAAITFYMCNVWSLIRKYGRPVIRALNDLGRSSNHVASEKVKHKAQALATQLSAALRSQEFFCAFLVSIFLLIAVTNVLAVPEVSTL